MSIIFIAVVIIAIAVPSFLAVQLRTKALDAKARVQELLLEVSWFSQLLDEQEEAYKVLQSRVRPLEVELWEKSAELRTLKEKFLALEKTSKGQIKRLKHQIEGFEITSKNGRRQDARKAAEIRRLRKLVRESRS